MSAHSGFDRAWARHRPDAALDRIVELENEIERLRDRAVCSGCGGDVAESGVCIDECGEGEMIPASDLPWALRQMRAERDELQQELNDV